MNESALSSNTLSRGENGFLAGASPLIHAGTGQDPSVADRWGCARRGPPGLASSSSRLMRAWPRGGARPDGARRRVRPRQVTGDLPTGSGGGGAPLGSLCCWRRALEREPPGPRRRGASASGGHGAPVEETEGRRAREGRRDVAHPSMMRTGLGEARVWYRAAEQSGGLAGNPSAPARDSVGLGHWSALEGGGGV